MTVAFEDVVITHRNPHCIAWTQATASLWGMAGDHDLDEPIRLTEEVPVRLRYEDDGRDHVVTDRYLSLTTERAGTHIAIQFYFKDGKFIETDLIGVPHLSFGETAIINPRSR